MKISLNWFKQYISTEKSPQELAEILTNTGLEVEGIEIVSAIKGGLEGVVVGHVLTCERHPNADKLSVTTVDVGEQEPLQIVCGAPNIAAGQKVFVATVGTRLYQQEESFVIKKSKIRGEVSLGMICGEDELGLGKSRDGIMILDRDAIVGMPAKEHLQIRDDFVFEIGITPNRSDAISHIGVARDVKASLSFMDHKPYRLMVPDVSEFSIDKSTPTIDVSVEDTFTCPRYSGIVITDCKVGDSPQWLKDYLNAIGISPINNLVDISNYVLFETGQPLHFFDLDKIKGGKISVKKVAEGTPFVTLDNVERKLSANDLMICDAEGPLCIAGVFGGINSGITQDTKSIFIESAYFNGASIRKSAKLHGLQTDASFRFERGCDPNATIYALKRASLLVKEICGGQISGDIIDVYPQVIAPEKIEVSIERITDLIGKNIPEQELVQIIEALDIRILSRENGLLLLEIPTYRVDVTREVDVIEEILRIYGFNNIEFSESIRSSLSYQDKPDPDGVRNMISDFLSSRGFYEIMNNSLTKSEYLKSLTSLDERYNVKIINSLSSELDVLRQTLLFGCLETVVYNFNRQQDNIRCYEFGKVYRKYPDKAVQKDPLERYEEALTLGLVIAGGDHPDSWKEKRTLSDFYTLKKEVYAILERVGFSLKNISETYISNDIYADGLSLSLKEDNLVIFGEVNNALLNRMGIKYPVYYAEMKWEVIMRLIKSHKILYQPISKFPEVRRDLALLVDHSVSYEQLEQMAWVSGAPYLKDVRLFDVYQGDNIDKEKKSYALSFILGKDEATLKDKEIDKIMSKIVHAFQQHLQVILR